MKALVGNRLCGNVAILQESEIGGIRFFDAMSLFNIDTTVIGQVTPNKLNRWQQT
jgi:hypothetical protein